MNRIKLRDPWTPRNDPHATNYECRYDSFNQTKNQSLNRSDICDTQDVLRFQFLRGNSDLSPSVGEKDHRGQVFKRGVLWLEAKKGPRFLTITFIYPIVIPLIMPLVIVLGKLTDKAI